jgi:hypothetical protein
MAMPSGTITISDTPFAGYQQARAGFAHLSGQTSLLPAFIHKRAGGADKLNLGALAEFVSPILLKTRVMVDHFLDPLQHYHPVEIVRLGHVDQHKPVICGRDVIGG